MNTITIIGQVVGFAAAAIMILSFQFKNNRDLFIAQVVSTALFSVHYMLLGIGGDSGAFSGMAQNFGGLLFRTVLVISEKREKWRSPLVLTAICAYCAVTAAFTFDRSNIICLLPMLGNMFAMGALWTRKPNVIRIEQFSVTTPCWLVFNISTNSLAGIVTEVFNLISIAVYYIRMFVKKRREKKQNGEKTNEKSENNGTGQL